MKRCGPLLLITVLCLSCRSPLHHDDLRRAALTVGADFGVTDEASGRTVVPDFAGATVTIAGNSGGLYRAGGYGFSGWTANPDGSGTLYVPGKTITMGSANVDLYARWRLIPGASWTERTVTGDMGGMNWQGITSAADGARIAAFSNYPCGIYASLDGGATWTKGSPAGTGDNTYWYDIGCSSDGNRILAGCENMANLLTSP